MSVFSYIHLEIEPKESERLIFRQIPRDSKLKLRMNVLNKCIYDDQTEYPDRNWKYHPVQCSYWGVQLGKYYVKVTKRMKSYKNRICVFTNSVSELLEPEYRLTNYSMSGVKRNIEFTSENRSRSKRRYKLRDMSRSEIGEPTPKMKKSKTHRKNNPSIESKSSSRMAPSTVSSVYAYQQSVESRSRCSSRESKRYSLRRLHF